MRAQRKMFVHFKLPFTFTIFPVSQYTVFKKGVCKIWNIFLIVSYEVPYLQDPVYWIPC